MAAALRKINACSEPRANQMEAAYYWIIAILPAIYIHVLAQAYQAIVRARLAHSRSNGATDR